MSGWTIRGTGKTQRSPHSSKRMSGYASKPKSLTGRGKHRGISGRNDALAVPNGMESLLPAAS
jgi:hypothetical protein